MKLCLLTNLLHLGYNPNYLVNKSRHKVISSLMDCHLNIFLSKVAKNKNLVTNLYIFPSFWGICIVSCKVNLFLHNGGSFFFFFFVHLFVNGIKDLFAICTLCSLNCIWWWGSSLGVKGMWGTLSSNSEK